MCAHAQCLTLTVNTYITICADAAQKCVRTQMPHLHGKYLQYNMRRFRAKVCAQCLTFTVWTLTVPSWLPVATRSKQMDRATEDTFKTNINIKMG